MVKFWVVGYLKGGDIPLLGKGGVAAHQTNVPVPLKARTGWFGQLPINRWLERTTPSARAKVASRNFLGRAATPPLPRRSEEHTSELQSLAYLVCRLLLEKKNKKQASQIVSLTGHR